MTEELQAIRCPDCGGGVMAKPSDMPRCVFCGNDASKLIPFDPEREVEQPSEHLPFAVSEAAATETFQTFARSSFWYPSDLRSADLSLRAVLLPCWIWSGTVETHWTGLVGSNTRSGKRPVGGSEAVQCAQVVVPSSKTLTLAEMVALGPFDESNVQSFPPENQDIPYELGEVTRSAARSAAQEVMSMQHRQQLASRQSFHDLRTSSVCTSLEGRPGLVPVYIGVFRYNDVSYRFLVNGQTAAHYGKAPTSWLKVLACFAAVGALALLAVAFVSTL